MTPTLHFIHNLRNYPNFLRFLTPKNIAWVYLRKNCLKKVLLYLLGSLEICYGHYFSLSWHFVLTIFHVPERSFRGERSFTYSLASLIRFTSLRSVKNCEPLLNPYFAPWLVFSFLYLLEKGYESWFCWYSLLLIAYGLWIKRYLKVMRVHRLCRSSIYLLYTEAHSVYSWQLLCTLHTPLGKSDGHTHFLRG